MLLPRSLAIIGYMLAGVQMARMCGTDDVIQIMKRTVGLWAARTRRSERDEARHAHVLCTTLDLRK